jgi:beta-aspartyl-dipeptidase (metallo-type)
LVSENPARRIGLFATKGSLEVGKDADLVVLNPDLNIDTVIAKGQRMVQEQRIRVKGTFEA